MKVTTNKKEKVFEPIELTITIENIDELKYLCAITDLTTHHVLKVCNCKFKFIKHNISDISVDMDNLLDSLQ